MYDLETLQEFIISREKFTPNSLNMLEFALEFEQGWIGGLYEEIGGRGGGIGLRVEGESKG